MVTRTPFQPTSWVEAHGSCWWRGSEQHLSGGGWLTVSQPPPSIGCLTRCEVWWDFSLTIAPIPAFTKFCMASSQAYTSFHLVADVFQQLVFSLDCDPRGEELGVVFTPHHHPLPDTAACGATPSAQFSGSGSGSSPSENDRLPFRLQPIIPTSLFTSPELPSVSHLASTHHFPSITNLQSPAPLTRQQRTTTTHEHQCKPVKIIDLRSIVRPTSLSLALQPPHLERNALRALRTFADQCGPAKI